MMPAQLTSTESPSCAPTHSATALLSRTSSVRTATPCNAGAARAASHSAAVAPVTVTCAPAAAKAAPMAVPMPLVPPTTRTVWPANDASWFMCTRRCAAVGSQRSCHPPQRKQKGAPCGPRAVSLMWPAPWRAAVRQQGAGDHARSACLVRVVAVSRLCSGGGAALLGGGGNQRRCFLTARRLHLGGSEPAVSRVAAANPTVS